MTSVGGDDDVTEGDGDDVSALRCQEVKKEEDGERRRRAMLLEYPLTYLPN